MRINKIYSVLFILFFSFQFSVFAENPEDEGRLQDGTEVVGGLGDDKKIPRSFVPEGSDMPLPPSEVWGFIVDIRNILVGFHEEARGAQQFSEKRELLVQGLDEAKRSFGEVDPNNPPDSLTYHSIIKSLQLNKDLSETQRVDEDEIAVYLLSENYNLIIETNVQFDLKFLEPHCDRHFHYHRSLTETQNILNSEDFYTDYGAYVLKVVSLAVKQGPSMGHDDLELILYQNLSKWAYQDLIRDGFKDRREYMAESTQLYNVFFMIHKYLEGPDRSNIKARHLREISSGKLEHIAEDLKCIQDMMRRHKNCKVQGGCTCFSE